METRPPTDDPIDADLHLTLPEGIVISPSAIAALVTELACAPTEAALVLAARHAATRSYSPYSSFRVGSAIADPAGVVTLGTNVENASYGLTMCAERSALFSHVAQGHARPILAAVSCIDGDASDPHSLMPCGACRQVIVELCDPTAIVIVDHVGRFTLEELLPQSFRLPG